MSANNSKQTTEAVPLPAHTIAVLAELEQAQRDLQQQAQGALRSAMRELKLQGNWRVDGGQLVKEG